MKQTSCGWVVALAAMTAGPALAEVVCGASVQGGGGEVVVWTVYEPTARLKGLQVTWAPPVVEQQAGTRPVVADHPPRLVLRYSLTPGQTGLGELTSVRYDLGYGRTSALRGAVSGHLEAAGAAAIRATGEAPAGTLTGQQVALLVALRRADDPAAAAFMSAFRGGANAAVTFQDASGELLGRTVYRPVDDVVLVAQLSQGISQATAAAQAYFAQPASARPRGSTAVAPEPPPGQAVCQLADFSPAMSPRPSPLDPPDRLLVLRP